MHSVYLLLKLILYFCMIDKLIILLYKNLPFAELSFGINNKNDTIYCVILNSVLDLNWNL